ncbi:MAG TPA: hypothetical protein VD967_02045 [Candidatus Paceibacterota bacterium]|nr:hypothetical protein [Candidatus Paceibacterota bacterium]
MQASRATAFEKAVAELSRQRQHGPYEGFVEAYEYMKRDFPDLLEGKSPHDIVWGKMEPEDAGDPLVRIAAESVAMRLGPIERIWDLAAYLGTKGYDRAVWCAFIRGKRPLLPRDDAAA